MSRNRTLAYINRFRKMEAPNGYKFDIANYLYNPSMDNEYPAFHIAETFTREKNGDAWQVVTNRTQKVLERSNRYNVKKLLSFCNE